MKKNNKAFIEKIKTIGINTGAKPEAPKCMGCGGKMVELKLKSVAVIPLRRRAKQPAADEQAFSA